MLPFDFHVLSRVWQGLPFRPMLLLVLFLFGVREYYPFSNFPMYSNLDKQADIIYITDQADEALPMESVFRTGSGTTKKMYKRELNALTKTTGRKLVHATAEDRAAAGRAVMATMLHRIRYSQVPPGVSQLRLYRKTFRLGENGPGHPGPERLVEQPLAKRKP
jgi:hypothetical protein